MRIGIDGGCLANRRGFGRFAREIVQALAHAGSDHEFVVFVDRPSLDQVVIPAGMATEVVGVGVAPSVAASAVGRRSVRDLLAMSRAVARAGLDAIYFPSSYSYFPVWNAGRVVVTMHDTLALAHPEWVFPGGRGQLAWRIKERVAVAQADRIVTVSAAAARDLAAWFRLPPGRLHQITEGPNPIFGPVGDRTVAARVLRQYGIDPDRRFLLYVGGLSPHKNLERLVEAFARTVSTADPECLVIVGDFADVFHTVVPTLRALVERLGRSGNVHFTGFVSDADLAHFYRNAYALVQPSLMEGFGLPPVEAMISGTPVLSSTAGSLPEVVGPAGLFFDPFQTDEIAHAIRTLLDQPNERDRLADLAQRQAAQFTWDRAARLLLDCFAGLANPRRQRSKPRRATNRPGPATLKRTTASR